jgi:hypothetical protein
MTDNPTQPPAPEAPRGPVQPSPVKEDWLWGTATLPDGTRKVVLSVYGPTGQTVHFLDPGPADKVADGLHQEAVNARSGLIVPGGNGIVRP